ncbi:MAG: tetratricopeptide repeat protein [Oryzomonas sp.]|uniref:TPR end-of-group domain-containing protein n=1 Tax=Oryzomonas sp. TaxID=2855186 RepID=UPI002844D038|nr:tetratricopeptide repeat protein [Oryzomonas sp.]MDR3580394.1 tetratricopeptide repeat protein [Oryzomonas sp.]
MVSLLNRIFHKFDRHSNHALLNVILLLGITAAVYYQSLGHQFIDKYDDKLYVIANPAIRGFTLDHLRAAFTGYYVGNYAPLHIISYMLDYSLWGLKPAGFICSNIILHALNGLLYYHLLVRLTANARLAFFAAFIFLFHPVQVESVVWISERKNVLAMFFLLVSLLSYIRYRNKNGSDRYSSYVLSIFAFSLALLSKSIAVILPPILVLYDCCFVARENRGRWLLDKLPFVAAAAMTCFLAVKSQQYGGAITSYHGGSAFATFLTMLTVFMRYAGMFFWPTDLSLIYTPPIKTTIDGSVAVAGFLVILSCFGLWCLFRKNRRMFFWAAIVPIAILPVAQIVPLVSLMNDRYLYFPLLGCAAIFSWGALLLFDRLLPRATWAGTCLLCLILLPLPVMSWQRSQVWHDSLALVSDTVQKYPTADAWVVFGDIMYSAGRFAESAAANENALLLVPDDRDALNNLGDVYLILGRYDHTVNNLEKLVSANPGYAKGYRLLGLAYLLMGNAQDGKRALSRSLQLEPDNGAMINKYGHVYERAGNFEVALTCYQQAIAVGGEAPAYYYDLARLDAIIGRRGEGLENLGQALRRGFKDTRQILQDPALDSLRSLPEFRKLLN